MKIEKFMMLALEVAKDRGPRGDRQEARVNGIVPMLPPRPQHRAGERRCPR
eukprot:CAMPEP_0184711644 /NCGR_PEP_ID=MMETSP0314-20130426/2295_1 /TAXON_ID=38298 /ORGANISM="Rhodella maculata, Strain CCMP 736" /LENGTH=50 /DNA_ID=CAMNT_0027173849 /DNA_START=315 /DNA_END=467 /DNA_ORIENTATION=+